MKRYTQEDWNEEQNANSDLPYGIYTQIDIIDGVEYASRPDEEYEEE